MIARKAALSDACRDTNDMRITAAGDEHIVQRPSCDRPFALPDFEIKSSPVADDKFRIQHPPHLLTHPVATNGSDEAKIANIYPENGQTRAAKAVGRLQQSAIPSDGND